VSELSRRTFLAGLTSPLLAPQSRAPIVDTHMHIWTADPARFPFSHPYEPNLKVPPIAATVELLQEEMASNGVDYAVLVQVIYHGWDNRYTAQSLARDPRRFRAHGLIDPTDPDVADKLAYWVREHRFSGMRLSPIYYRGKDEWVDSPAHERLWKRAEELGSIFNYFIAAPQLERLERMLAKFPGVRIVIDHLARIDLAGGDAAGETARLTRLARYPNVWVKVTELNILSPSKKYPYSDTFPWVRRVYDAFGPDRLLWGTGFPGATRAQAGRPSLAEELRLVREEIPFFTAEDREKLLGRNAVKLWKFGA
jgi:predicted TIM-barrel fold metal-dependent hydrolase